MTVRLWHAVAVSMLALAAAPGAYSTDLPAQPPPDAPMVTPPTTANQATGTSSSVSDLLAPLREFGVESWWDVVQFQPWGGSIGFTFDGQKQRITAPDTPDQVFSSRIWNETLTISNDGISIIDPRLFNLTVILGITLQQERLRTGDINQSEHGTLTNYAFNGAFLQESPYNLNIFAQRTEDTYVQPSGSVTHSDIENRGIVFRLHENSILRDREILPYFTGNFGVYQQYEKQTTTLAGQSFVVNDRRDQVQLGFQNGGETSDTSFQYQYTKLDNYAYSAGSYDSQTANALYSVDFGPTRNWRSDSRVNYYTRRGRTPDSDFNTLDANEFLTIDHNENVSSNYNYQLTRQSAPVGTTLSQSGGVQVNEQVFRNLSLTQGVNGIYTTLPGGTLSSAGVAGSFNYGHALPWEGQLTLSGGGGYAITSNKVPSGISQVTDAPYAVPSEVGAGSSILLNDRNILTDTIIVVVIKSGGTRVPAVVDVDYTVRVDGDRTSLVPLASSVVMQPGEPLNVSYSFELPPNSKFRTVSASASFGLDWPYFGLYYSHDESDQTPLSGSDATLLVSQHRDAGTVYSRGIWDTFQFRVAAGLVRYDSPQLAYNERRFDQFVSYRPWENLQFNLTANQVRTDYHTPVHVTTTNSVRLDAQWNWGQWQTSGYAGWRSYTDTEQPSETVSEAGFYLRRTWTKLDLTVAGTYQRRTKNEITSPNAIIHVGVVRRF